MRQALQFRPNFKHAADALKELGAK